MKRIFLSLALMTGSLSLPAIPIKPDIFCLAKAIHHEARGEPLKGQIAVAHVIINRSKLPSFGSDVCEVIYQPGQFSGISKQKNNGSNYYTLAAEVLEGKYDYLNINALYFHAKKVNPYWHRKKVAVIGNHIFYK